MPNITLSVPLETKRKMDAHPHMRWSRAIRTLIEQRLEDFEEAERLAKKLNLKMEDFKEIEEKIKESSRKHVRTLLNESHR